MAKLKEPCITCGRNFSGDTKQLIEHYKQEYEKHGIARWVYVDNNEVSISRNFIKGKEYFHIAEWNPK